MRLLISAIKKYFLLLLILTAFILPSNAEKRDENQTIEVAFVLDTTGSMANLIDGAKRKIWSIANTIIDVNPDAEIRMALIAYRDRGDDYVTKTYELSSDVQGLYSKLVKLEADGGGDKPESVNEALDEAVRKLKWTQGGRTKRIIFLVGDAPPHMDYPNAPLYPNILKIAKADGIIVNTVQAGDDLDTKKVWQEIAQLGHGRYLSIPQDGGKIVVIKTPFDDEIIIIQKEIDKTVLPYGSRIEQKEMHNKMSAKAEASESVQIDNSRFYVKKAGSKEVVTGRGDLIADMRNKLENLDDIKEDELPKIMQGKPSVEKQKIIEKIDQERSKLEQKMAELIAKRDAYIADQPNKPEKDDDSFETAVKSTLTDQLK